MKDEKNGAHSLQPSLILFSLGANGGGPFLPWAGSEVGWVGTFLGSLVSILT
jgi:hypothetical protein